MRARGRRGEVVPLAEQRRRFVGRWHALIAEMAAAQIGQQWGGFTARHPCPEF